MSQRDKLFAHIRSNPKNVRFKQLDQLLCLFGFERRAASGSHNYYSRPGCKPISVPFARPIKQVYVERALRAIESCEENPGE